jgi:8-oxo-dGTP diphosphatase
MGGRADLVAAGAVVAREGREVLLIHRPKYDDWSFPKGKLDSGEHVVAAAVREVAEETGLDIRLGAPLGLQQYTLQDGAWKSKEVHYWCGSVVGDDDVSTYAANREVDQVGWVPIDLARQRLTHDHDRVTLTEFERVGTSCPLVVLRHTAARSRTGWTGDDRRRTLTEAGELQAEQLVPVLAAYGVERVVSSSSRRCVDSVLPYADMSGVDVETTDDLAEEDGTRAAVTALVDDMVAARRPAVLCSHRPVLPWVFEALSLEDPKLEPGSMTVVHHRRGSTVAVEQHDPVFR